MFYQRFDRDFLVRLERGEELLESLRELMRREGIGCGAVAGLGATQKALMGFYDLEAKRYDERLFEGFFEIVGLTGSLSWYDGEPFPHVHLVLGDREFHAWTGHCFTAEVSATVELAVRAWEPRVERVMDADIGLHLMQLPTYCERARPASD